MRLPSEMSLIAKVALGGAFITVGMGVTTFVKHQNEMRSSIWLGHIKDTLNNHPGVKKLIGETPVRLGVLTRRKLTYELPSVDIDPPATHLLTMSVKGDKGKGTLYAWLNNPSGRKIETVNDWNVARLELQIGRNNENKMPIVMSE